MNLTVNEFDTQEFSNVLRELSDLPLSSDTYFPDIQTVKQNTEETFYARPTIMWSL